ncbi:MAG: NAD-dependent epimerase/dehydratase family protein [Thermodesulfobacteriota bacterium]
MKIVDIFSGQKILVTGGSGFIGPHLCRALSNSDAEIHAVSRKVVPTSGKSPRWWSGDLSEINTARSLVQTIRPDVIFHLAGYAVGGRDLSLILPTLSSNLMTTVNLLTAATEIGCRRIVVAGSLEEPTPEDLVPSSPYAVSKWAGSAYARMFFQLYKTPVVIARIFMTYGPAEPNLNKIIPYVIRSLLRGESPKLGSGKREVDWIYVQDVVEGLIRAAEAENIEGGTVDLGSGELVPIRKMVEKLFEILGADLKPVFGTLPDRPLEQIRVADIEGSRARLGWRPQTSLEKGLERTVDWYKNQMEKDRADES